MKKGGRGINSPVKVADGARKGFVQGMQAGAAMGKTAVILIVSWLGLGVVAIECILHF
jgi:hypothetical protein